MSVKAFKGFNKDLTCRGFQYEEGKEFETERAESCEAGFHACEYPLDVFRYYSPSQSIFHEVEMSGDMDRETCDSKICSTKIKIGAKLNIAGLVKCAIDFTMARINKEANSDERHGASSATGNYGASSATGNYGASSATGYRGASSATGDYGASSATGDYGASSATGNCGASSATGYRGASSVSDPTGVAVAWGHEARAKGCKGSHLILSDWRYTGERYSDGDYKHPYDKDCWELSGAVMVVVDGEKIKEDTYYRCIEGTVVEVDEDGDIVE